MSICRTFSSISKSPCSSLDVKLHVTGNLQLELDNVLDVVSVQTSEECISDF